ncbi:MAG: metallophosphoesterase [Pseudomonadota bacterium]
MRILATADIHLGSPIRSLAMRNPDLAELLRQASRDVFARVVDLTLSEGVDALAIAGDVFDSDQPDLRLRAFFLRQIQRATAAGIPCLIIRGNHDALLERSADLPEGAHLLTKDQPSIDIGGAVIHGLSFDTTHLRKSFLPDYPAPWPGRINIGLMHSSLDGSPGHDRYAPCKEADLLAHGYDLWCLGHIHAPFERRADGTLAVMPGIPQPRHFGERGGGTVAIVELSEGAAKITHHPVARLAFEAVELDLTDTADLNLAMDKLRAQLDARTQGAEATALRLMVKTSAFGEDELSAIAQELLEDHPSLHLDRVRVAPPAGTDAPEADDLMRLMRAEIASPAFELARDTALADLRDALPREARDALQADDAEALVAEALQLVRQRMRGGA